jgi:hypothetical protein
LKQKFHFKILKKNKYIGLAINLSDFRQVTSSDKLIAKPIVARASFKAKIVDKDRKKVPCLDFKKQKKPK